MLLDIAALLLLVPVVLGHGQVRSFITSSKTYPAADAYASAADPNSPIRKLNTYGPAAPFTGADITCGVGLSSFRDWPWWHLTLLNSPVGTMLRQSQLQSPQGVPLLSIGVNGLQGE